MPKPKVIDFIEQAYENKIPMTIATSTDRPMIEAAFKRLHIDKYLQKNIYHDRGWTWKRQTGHLHKSNGRNGNNTKANMAI